MNEVAARTNLLDLDRAGLERFFAEELGEKRFRAHQVMKWMYHRHVTEFAEMTDLGKALRAKLEDKAVVMPPAVQFEKPALDAIRKWRFSPGQKDGQPVRTYIRVPMRFRVNSG